MSMQYFMLITDIRNTCVTTEFYKCNKTEFYQCNKSSNMEVVTYFYQHNVVLKTKTYQEFTRQSWIRYNNNNNKKLLVPIYRLNFGALSTRQLISHSRANLCSARAAGRPKLPKHYLRPGSLPPVSRSSTFSGNTTTTGSTTNLIHASTRCRRTLEKDVRAQDQNRFKSKRSICLLKQDHQGEQDQEQRPLNDVER
jgi:hypothetical protein